MIRIKIILKYFIKSIIIITSLNLIFVNPIYAAFNIINGAPYILYTDAVSGPIAGGENDNGAYLSLYGINFGKSAALGNTTKVYIGNEEVASYKTGVEDSAVFNKFGIQKITVQVGAIGNPTLLSPLPVKISVNGVESNSNITFTPNDGHILFVSLNGNDSTATIGDITKPYRHLQTSSNRDTAGAYADIQAGDHIVIRGGDWSDTAFESAWLRFRDRNVMGTATRWIHFTSYPGETVTYTTPAGAKGGFQGPASAYAGTTGEYISFSNFSMIVNKDAEDDAAPFNQQYGEGAWRVINNNIGPWPSLIDARAGGYSGGGQGTKIVGNYIHDIRRICDSVNKNKPNFNTNCPSGAVGRGESLLNHGIYIDGGANDVEVAFNDIYNILEGNGIQTYASNELDIDNISLHHNYLIGTGKFGINLSSQTFSGNIYNNLIIESEQSGITFNVAGGNMAMIVAQNTFVNCDKARNYGQISNQWGSGLKGNILITNNIVYTDEGVSEFYNNIGDPDNYINWGKNLYYDGTMRPVSGAGTVILENPKFVSPGDFRLQNGSPAKDAAETTGKLTILTDIMLNARPGGGENDIGAFELDKTIVRPLPPILDPVVL
jgi:hypothetical protein